MTKEKPKLGQSLSDLYPEIASQAIGFNPQDVRPYSGKKLRWKCSVGHEWLATVGHRTRLNNGCPFCAGQKVLEGFNDLATTHPELASQAVGWDPKTVSAGSNKKLLWRCELGHEWISTVKNRSLERNCPFCAGRKVLEGFNDLATTHPELASQAVGWDPKTVSAGTHKVVTWRCELEHEWKSELKNRTVMKAGCPVCSGNLVLEGFNDLATTHPELASQAVGWDPKTVSAGSNKKLLWRCELGHEWSSTVANRSLERNCPSCTVYGFDPNKDAWLYFLDHDEWQMFQIGITNSPDDRLARHMGIGWTVLEIRGAMDGAATRNLETAILQSLKRRGAVFANNAGVKKFDGFTESWLKSSVKVSGLKELMDFVHEDESLEK